MNQEIQQLAEEFKNLSNEPSIDIEISPLAAWMLISQLQLALTHPENDGEIAAQTRAIAQALQSRLELSPTMENLLARGWHRDYDAEPNETNEEYFTRIPQREIIEVHNAYSFYTQVISFSRPQDWGNKEIWAYERFKFEWLQETKHYINHAHCWYNPHDVPRGKIPMIFGGAIATISMPGKPEELCSNKYLAPEDFWHPAWGEMPEFYLPEEEDIYE